MTQVNEINMAKWIVALRSGKYKQGTGMLRRDDSFCCLGVACDISELGVWRDGTSRYSTPDSDSSFVLPYPVADWLGVDFINPPLTQKVHCSSANDDHRWTFGQIADAAESTYLPGKKAEEILEAASV